MPIQVDTTRRRFLLVTEQSSYAFGFDQFNLPVNLHWGGRIGLTDLPDPEELLWHRVSHYRRLARRSRDEFSFHSGDYLFYEPCLKIQTPAHFATVPLAYERYAITGEHLAVYYHLADLKLVMHYEVFPEFDLCNRWVEVINESESEIVFENLFSAAWILPRGRKYRLTHLYGAWGKEYQVQREVLTPGEKVLESRTGISGHLHAPFFALDEDGRASELEGTVWFGTLQWSGSWKIIIEYDAVDTVRIIGGLNNFDFELALSPGETFITPVFTAGFSRAGFSGASQQLHRYQQNHLYPKNMRSKVMPVLFNSYACLRGDDVSEDNLLQLIPRAAEVGVELFVVDAGWQNNMGDWRIDPKKFPQGFSRLIKTVKQHGMQFGLWMEFERVNADSTAYQEHPTWRMDNAWSSIWNLADKKVLEHLYGCIKEILIKNEIDYLKIDLNRLPLAPETVRRKRINTQYVKNFYELFRRLKNDFPNVIFENCASGSGRLDLKMDEFFARINRSDNQDTLDILSMHEGFTYLHPARMAGGGCHLSEDMTYLVNRRVFPLEFMAHAALMGWFAIGMPLHRATAEDLAAYQAAIALYKKVRHITAFGDLYRLASWRLNKYAAFEYVLPDASEALLCVFGHAFQFGWQLPYLRLAGLDPNGIYQIDVYGQRKQQKKAICDCDELPYRPLTGQALKEIGLHVTLCGDLDSRVFHLRKKIER